MGNAQATPTTRGLTGRRFARRCALAVLLALVVVPLDAAAARAASAAPTPTLTPPPTIKVARRFPANDPNGVIVRVDTVDFRTYCARVLSHEWAPPSAFSDEALKAGALAVKEYAWYWATRPTKMADVAAWGADVDDSTNYQVYMDWDYGQRYRDAVASTWGTTLTLNGQIFQASYYAGAYSPTATDGYHMTQWGSQYWADQGKSYQWILSFYYPGVQPAASSGGGDSAAWDASGGTTGTTWAGPDAPQGTPKLEVVGPIQLGPGPYRQGAVLKASFTLRNAGGREDTWPIVTLVGRGPAGQSRDLGTAYDVTLQPGQYRMYVGKVRLDLVGRWRGWLVVGDGQTLQLLDGGAPFSLKVLAPAQASGAGSRPRGAQSSRAQRSKVGTALIAQ
jgi:Stage II sporulation protein